MTRRPTCPIFLKGNSVIPSRPMFSASLVVKAWHILRLGKEATTSWYRMKLPVYCTSSCGPFQISNTVNHGEAILCISRAISPLDAKAALKILIFYYDFNYHTSCSSALSISTCAVSTSPENGYLYQRCPQNSAIMSRLHAKWGITTSALYIASL